MESLDSLKKSLEGIKCIGFDGKRAVLNYSGLGNYSRLALELIGNALPDTRLRIYSQKTKENPQLSPVLANRKARIVTPDTFAGHLFGNLWRGRLLSSQIKREGIDLFHGLSNKLPIGIDRTGIPSVVTIHDLIFLPHPEFYHSFDARTYARNFRRSADLADRIIAISECTRRDLINYYDIDPGKIDVVYQGCDKSFYDPVTPEKIAEVRRKYSLPERYIVGVGTIEARKNQLLALRALPMIPADTDLVLVGRPTKYVRLLQAEAERLGVSSRLHFIHGASFADFPAFYAGALLSSYPSRYEGFGIPVVESLATSTPVVAATGSCLEEAGGPGAFYVNPDSPREFADAVEKIIGSPGLRMEMTEKGRRHIERFSAGEFTRGLLSVYTKTLEMK